MDTLASQVADLLTLSMEGDVTDGELADLARRLSTSQVAIEQLRLLAEMLQLELAARVENDVTPVPGVGLIERGYTRRSKWRTEDSPAELRHDIADAVTSALSLDIATGELDPVKRNIARAAIDALWDILPAFQSVKQPARRYGIRISDYREYSDVPVVRVVLEGA